MFELITSIRTPTSKILWVRLFCLWPEEVKSQWIQNSFNSHTLVTGFDQAYMQDLYIGLKHLSIVTRNFSKFKIFLSRSVIIIVKPTLCINKGLHIINCGIWISVSVSRGMTRMLIYTYNFNLLMENSFWMQCF